MLHSARHARNAVRSTPPLSQLETKRSCTFCATAGAQRFAGQSRAKQVVRPRAVVTEWTQPSTSKIPYSPSCSLSTAVPVPPPAPEEPSRYTAQLLERRLAAFIALESPAARLAARDDICRLIASYVPEPSPPSAHPPVSLERDAFDSLFAQTAELEADAANPILKRLRDFAIKRQRWELSFGQARAVAQARLSQEEREARTREAKHGPDKTRRKASPKSRDRAGLMRQRQRYLDQCFDEYWTLLSARLPVRDDALTPDQRASHADDADLLARYSHRLARRLPLSTESEDTILRSHTFSLRALALSKPLRHPDTNPAFSELLPFLFRLDAFAALAQLRAMCDKGHLPRIRDLKDILSDHFVVGGGSQSAPLRGAAAEEAAYARARKLLDRACSADTVRLFGRKGDDPLEALAKLQEERLKTVERTMAIEKAPLPYFVRWLGLQRGRATDGKEAFPVAERQEGLEVALRLWETSQVKGKDEWDLPALTYADSPAAKLLSSLVVEACRLENESAKASGWTRQSGRKPRMPSKCLVTAADLARRCMIHHVLVKHSGRLLRALTVSSTAPLVALSLFDRLSVPPELSSTIPPSDANQHPPFAWSPGLRETFVALFFSSAAARDPSLPIRLYLSWTASGLSFPVSLWNELWRALGRRGSIDELKRVVHDWEETGRGKIEGRIMQLVLEAAAGDEAHASSVEQWQVLSPLRLLTYFRSRYAPSPQSRPPQKLIQLQPYLLIPVAGYNAVLRSLSRSFCDRRDDMQSVWRQMIQDGHTPDARSYNTLIAAHVWRPGYFRTQDLDAAGVAYNELVVAWRNSGKGKDRQSAARLEPDRETFSLIVHGFLRVAESPRYGRDRRSLTLEAALRTFSAACERGQGVRGHQTAKLVRLLATEGRFEDAKMVQEKWWRDLVALEAKWPDIIRTRGRKGRWTEAMWDDAQVAAEVREMRMARLEAEKVEARRVALMEEKEEQRDAADERDEATTSAQDDAVSPEAFSPSPLALPLFAPPTGRTFNQYAGEGTP
ncbi:hypothetical protein Rt10032_c02g0643 [Rhodotorula toruloides]|uniref:Uncharacterized protein n=1 Tax=Rhodotorula toruloides TaxID=5286 RepID=A0A511K9J3_RHOTO|nr:hypothetical protein Rt10032_c02g0643 [Rhodotorula toruloides]